MTSPSLFLVALYVWRVYGIWATGDSRHAGVFLVHIPYEWISSCSWPRSRKGHYDRQHRPIIHLATRDAC
eukprot:jgi/Botrbrau1/2267/Bobra.101_2s0090.1